MTNVDFKCVQLRCPDEPMRYYVCKVSCDALPLAQKFSRDILAKLKSSKLPFHSEKNYAPIVITLIDGGRQFGFEFPSDVSKTTDVNSLCDGMSRISPYKKKKKPNTPTKAFVTFSPVKDKTDNYDQSTVEEVLAKPLVEVKMLYKFKCHCIIKFNDCPDFQFDADQFKAFLESAASSFEFAIDGEKVVENVGILDFKSMECKVEFTNEHYARRLCTIPHFQFNGTEFVIAQEMSVYPAKERIKRPTRNVKVSNLPLFFFEAHFKYYMNDGVKKANISAEDVVRSVRDYDPQMHTCLVEFPDEDCAMKVGFMKDFTYENKTLLFQVLEEEVVMKPSNVVRVSNLPTHFFQGHFTYHMDSLALKVCDSAVDKVPVKSVTSYNKQEGSCIVEFKEVQCATKVAEVSDFIYEGKTLTFKCIEEEGLVCPTKFVKVSNLPDFFHEPHFTHHLNDTARIYRMTETDAVRSVSSYVKEERTCIVEFIDYDIPIWISAIAPHIYCGTKLKMELHQQQPHVEEHSSEGDSQGELVTYEGRSPDDTPIPDIILKASRKPGQIACGKQGGVWDTAKTMLFLKLHETYSKIGNSNNIWDEIRAHLWYQHNLDYSKSQLTEKMRGLKTYFVNTIMNSEAGKNGTSTYPFYHQMLNLHPHFKSQINSSSKEIPVKTCNAKFRPITASNDTWDKAAILLLVSHCTEKQGMLNSVSGTERARDVYDLISKAMSEEGRYFTGVECKQRMAALSASFTLSSDLQISQTGAGSAGQVLNDPDIHSALTTFHAGSTGIEAPAAYSFGSELKIKKGSVAAVKVIGEGKTSKPKKVWNWKTDAALTPRQQSVQADFAKLELQREIIDYFRQLKEERERRCNEQKK